MKLDVSQRECGHFETVVWGDEHGKQGRNTNRGQGFNRYHYCPFPIDRRSRTRGPAIRAGFRSDKPGDEGEYQDVSQAGW
jgi:hypothetical protein